MPYFEGPARQTCHRAFFESPPRYTLKPTRPCILTGVRWRGAIFTSSCASKVFLILGSASVRRAGDELGDRADEDPCVMPRSSAGFRGTFDRRWVRVEEAGAPSSGRPPPHSTRAPFVHGIPRSKRPPTLSQVSALTEPGLEPTSTDASAAVFARPSGRSCAR